MSDRQPLLLAAEKPHIWTVPFAPYRWATHMDVNVSPDASSETLAALRAVGEAAAEKMRNEDDAALRNYLSKPKGLDE